MALSRFGEKLPSLEIDLPHPSTRGANYVPFVGPAI